MMEVKNIAIIGGYVLIFFVGAWVGSKYSDASSLDCTEGSVSIIRCVDTTSITETDVADETFIQYYKESVEDSIGFSLDKGLLDILSFYISNTPNANGVRVYPGMRNNNKLLIIKPLNADGVEIPNLGSLITSNLGSNRGPCPKWCDNSTRLIK